MKPQTPQPRTAAGKRFVLARNELEQLRERLAGRVGDTTPFDRAIQLAEQELAEAFEALKVEQAAVEQVTATSSARVTALRDIVFGNGKRDRVAAGAAIPEGSLPEDALRRLEESGQVHIAWPAPEPVSPRFVVAGRLALATNHRGIVPPGAGIDPADFKSRRRFDEHVSAGRIVDTQPDPEPPLAA